MGKQIEALATSAESSSGVAVLIAIGMVLFVILKLAELWIDHRKEEPAVHLPCSNEVPKHLQEVGRSLERVGVALDRLDERAASHASGPRGESEPFPDPAQRPLPEPGFARAGSVSAQSGKGFRDALRVPAVAFGKFC